MSTSYLQDMSTVVTSSSVAHAHKCPGPAPTPRFSRLLESNSSDSISVFSCKTGYRPADSGNLTSVCQNGTWVGDVSGCVEDSEYNFNYNYNLTLVIT